MTTRRRPEGSVLFAELALVAAATGLVGVLAFAFAADTDPARAADDASSSSISEPDDGVELDDGAEADAGADPQAVVQASATAMGDVTSVEFRLARTGAPVYIDEFESLAIDTMLGQFTVPERAQAQITVTVDDNLTTEIGAVAVDGDVWMSNPVTGDFATLPPGFEIDPSQFFDPAGGWEPLLANLRDVELVGIDDRGGERYHLRGVAPAAEVENITVGLVRDQDVPVDLWIHPTTYLVTNLEFDTVLDGAESHWMLGLDRYGATFTIEPPVNVGEADAG